MAIRLMNRLSDFNTKVKAYAEKYYGREITDRITANHGLKFFYPYYATDTQELKGYDSITYNEKKDYIVFNFPGDKINKD